MYSDQQRLIEDNDFNMDIITGIEDLQHNNKSTYEARLVMNYYNLPEYRIYGMESEEQGLGSKIMEFLKKILANIKSFLFGNKAEKAEKSNDEVEKELDEVADSPEVSEIEPTDEIKNICEKVSEGFKELNEELEEFSKVETPEADEEQYETWESYGKEKQEQAAQEREEYLDKVKERQARMKYRRDGKKIHVATGRFFSNLGKTTWNATGGKFFGLFKKECSMIRKEIDGVNLKLYDVSSLRKGDIGNLYKYNKKNIKIIEKARKKTEKEGKKRADELQRKIDKGPVFLEQARSKLIEKMDKQLILMYAINDKLKAPFRAIKKGGKAIKDHMVESNKSKDKYSDDD